MDYGIKVTPPGYDVLTATDAQTQFSTKYSTLKIYKWGNLSLTTDGSGNGSVAYAHNLDYAPAHFVFRKGTASFSFLDGSSYTNSYFQLGSVNYFADSADTYHRSFKTYTDDTYLYITATGAQASTTYNFRFYILVDLAEAFSGDDNTGVLKDYGMKVSQEGFDVETAKEYQMAFSSKYKSLQYYDQHIYTQQLSLPAFFASPVDTFVEAGTYVDFNHELGYAPFFLSFYEYTSGGNTRVESIPRFTENGIDIVNYNVAAFCDVTRVRVYFYKSSTYALSTLYDNWSAETIEIKLYVFTENLGGSENK